MTVLLLLALAAFICAVAAAAGRVPVWVSVIIICVYLLLQSMPLGG